MALQISLVFFPTCFFSILVALPYQEILDQTRHQATDGRHARLTMSPSEEDHGTGGGHGRQYHQTTRVVADEQACPGGTHRSP